MVESNLRYVRGSDGLVHVISRPGYVVARCGQSIASSMPAVGRPPADSSVCSTCAIGLSAPPSHPRLTPKPVTYIPIESSGLLARLPSPVKRLALGIGMAVVLLVWLPIALLVLYSIITGVWDSVAHPKPTENPYAACAVMECDIESQDMYDNLRGP